MSSLAQSRTPSNSALVFASLPASLSSKKRQQRQSLSLVPTKTPVVDTSPIVNTKAIVHEGLQGPDSVLMKKQAGFVERMMDYYFRLEIGGWENLPKQPSLLIGVHSGGPLTMDAWTICYAWWRQFQGKRTLHATAHDVLMNTPKLGSYFRRMGVISPTRENIQAEQVLFV